MNPHRTTISAWEEAMRFGLLGGRPFSENCINCYVFNVRRFLGEFDELSIETLKKALLGIPVAHFAKRQKLFHALMSFARYLIQEKLMDESYAIEAKRYKPRRHLPEKKMTVDQASLDKLLDACTNTLDELIVILLSHTGLRASEAASLLLSDIDFEKKILTVRLAKWGKTRRVGLQDRVIDALREYLRTHPEVECAQKYLFYKKSDTPLSLPMDRFGIGIRLRTLSKRAKVKATPHALRRAFVTLNANKGRPLVMLQLACGHSNITTTRSYCMTSEEEMIEAMQGWI